MDAVPLERPELQAKVFSPSYRIEFHPLDKGQSESWRLTGAVDVIDAVNWARSQTVRHTFVIYVEMPSAHGCSVLRVYDGTPSSDPDVSTS